MSKKSKRIVKRRKLHSEKFSKLDDALSTIGSILDAVEYVLRKVQREVKKLARHEVGRKRATEAHRQFNITQPHDASEMLEEPSTCGLDG